MSGDDPISKGVKAVSTAATDLVYNPITETSRFLGLNGLADLSQGLKKFEQRAVLQTGDLVTGENVRRRKEGEQADEADAQHRGAVAAAANKKASDDAFADSEKQRMSAGAGARTMLTGPAGLEDANQDEQGYSIARKYLKGS